MRRSQLLLPALHLHLLLLALLLLTREVVEITPEAVGESVRCIFRTLHRPLLLHLLSCALLLHLLLLFLLRLLLWRLRRWRSRLELRRSKSR